MALTAQRTQLPAGFVLTVTADASSSGTVRRWPDSGSSTNYSPQAIAASGTVVLGPFNTARNYEILSSAGQLTYTQAVDEDLGEDETLTGDTKIDQFSGVAANFNVIPSTREITTPANTQSVAYDTFTINGVFTLGGELRIGVWPF